MPRPSSLALLCQAVPRCAIVFAATLAPLAALAQSAVPDPLRPDGAAPMNYRSPFEGYRSFRADELPEWRNVNDVVRSVGGHTGSVRQAEPGSAPAAAPTTRSQAPEAPAPKAVPSMPVQTEEPSHGHNH